MNHKKIVTIEFADIFIRFVLPSEARLPSELIYFQSEDSKNVAAEYTVELLEKPLALLGELVATAWEMEIYKEEKGWIRVYLPLVEKDGYQVACRINADGKNKIYYPSYRWSFYSQELNLLHLIGIEEILVLSQ